MLVCMLMYRHWILLGLHLFGEVEFILNAVGRVIIYAYIYCKVLGSKSNLMSDALDATFQLISKTDFFSACMKQFLFKVICRRNNLLIIYSLLGH